MAAAEAKEEGGSGGSGGSGEHSGERGGWVTRGNNHEVVEFCYAPTPWPTAIGDARALVATADVNAAATANAAVECGVGGGASAGGAAGITNINTASGAGAAAGAADSFRSTLATFYDESSAVGGALLGCVAEALGLDRGHFAAAASPGEVRRDMGDKETGTATERERQRDRQRDRETERQRETEREGG